MAKLKWAAPPAPRASARGEWTREAAPELMKRPGKWAIVTTKKTAQAASVVAAHIRIGRYVAFRPNGKFESAARTVSGEHRVYARYVGK